MCVATDLTTSERSFKEIHIGHSLLAWHPKTLNPCLFAAAQEELVSVTATTCIGVQKLPESTKSNAT